MILTIQTHRGRKEKCYQQKHFQKRSDNIKVRINSKTKQQKGMFVDSNIGSWHLDFHFSQQRDSQLMFKSWFWFLASSTEWHDMSKLHSVSKWMDVIDVHPALIDLLSREDVRLNPCFL